MHVHSGYLCLIFDDLFDDLKNQIPELMQKKKPQKKRKGQLFHGIIYCIMYEEFGSSPAQNVKRLEI